MAIVKGQWYQRKDYPDQFYKVSRVASIIQLYPYDTTRYAILNVQPAYLLANFRLLDSAPQNYLIDGLVDGTAVITRAFVVVGPVIWGSVAGNASVSQSHALLVTTLLGKPRGLFRVPKTVAYLSTMQTRGNVQSYSTTKGNAFTRYPLGGHLAARGSVVQAQAN